MPRTTLVIRAAELGKCVSQTVISDVELHWGAAMINYVTGPNPLEILDILSNVSTRRCMIF